MDTVYKPNERIIDRVVSLWKQMLSAPKYDNGDPTPTGGIAAAMAMTLPSNNTPEVLDRFGQELRARLMNPDPKYGSWCTSLYVDYHPDGILGEAASAAGLVTQFPWKTSMHFWTDHVSVKKGYGSEYVRHYPLSNDRWLETRLSGEDITKVIQLVEDGVLNLDLSPALAPCSNG